MDVAITSKIRVNSEVRIIVHIKQMQILTSLNTEQKLSCTAWSLLLHEKDLKLKITSFEFQKEGQL